MLILFTLFYSVINKIILPQISKLLKVRKKILQFYVDSTRQLYLESISALEFNIKIIDNSLADSLDAIQSTISHSNSKVSAEIEKAEASSLKDANMKYLGIRHITCFSAERLADLSAAVDMFSHAKRNVR